MDAELHIVVKTVKPVQTNDMYFSVPKKRKDGKGTWFVPCRTPALKEFQKIMELALTESVSLADKQKFIDTYNEIISLGRYPHIEVVTLVGLATHKEYSSMDSSNMIKAYEDCITKFIGIDDSETYSYKIMKTLNTDTQNYSFETIMTIVDEDKSWIENQTLQDKEVYYGKKSS